MRRIDFARTSRRTAPAAGARHSEVLELRQIRALHLRCRVISFGRSHPSQLRLTDILR